MTTAVAKMLSRSGRASVAEHLSRDPLRNLLLLDMVDPGEEVSLLEPFPQVVYAERDGAVSGVASLRPSIALSSDLDDDGLDAVFPQLSSVDIGLVKSPVRLVDSLWDRLYAQGRRAIVDRVEVACVLTAGDGDWPEPAPGLKIRSAVDADLESLVFAARASLREEGRPDPFDGDPTGFRRWVRGRMHRARVVEVDGEVVFVGYADVQRPEGWLIQGVYTWREHRRRGYAVAGMQALSREAFEHGADHVQLAVVGGNTAAMRLYEGMGFRAFVELRTILFG